MIFSNRWQTMSNKVLNLHHAKRWGFSKYKFLQFSKPQTGCEADLNQNTNVAKATGPIVLSVTALVVFLLVIVCRSENLKFSHLWECWPELIFSFSRLLDFIGDDHLFSWLQYNSLNIWVTTLIRAKKYLALLLEPCTSLALFNAKVMNSLTHQDLHGLAQIWNTRGKGRKVLVWVPCACHLCINRMWPPAMSARGV